MRSIVFVSSLLSKEVKCIPKPSFCVNEESTLLSRHSSADDCQGVFVNQNIFVLITVILVKGWAETGHEEECGE